MDVPRSELQNLIPNNNGANGIGNGQIESNEDQINNNPDGNGNGQREGNGNQNNSSPNGNGNGQRESNGNQNNNCSNGNGNGQREGNGNQNNNSPNGNGNGQRERNGNQNCEAGKECVPKELTYVSFVVNGIFLGLVLCFLVLYLVGGNDDYKDDLQSSRGAQTSPEDSFYSCLPCEPMVRTDDADTMRLYMKSSSMVCCKKMIYPVVNIEIPITSQISEKCQSNKTSKEDIIGALLYINHNQTFHTSGLHWMLDSSNTYIKGGVGYEELHRYGRLTVPSDGVYAVYTYIQFDSYTLHVNSTLDRPKPEMHVLYKNGNQLIQLNKFMLRQHSYITSHVGPILVELKTRDSIHVAVGSMGRFIHNNPQSSVFGLYKL